MPRTILPILMTTALLLGEDFAKAQQKTANYDESKIAPYTLPELLKTTDGKAVTTADEWTNLRRPEVLARQDLPAERTGRKFWKHRYRDIRHFERYLDGLDGERLFAQVSKPGYVTEVQFGVKLDEALESVGIA